MTQEVGVDPLASNKGFWGEILGVGDFYYDVAVQIVDICLQTRDQNGGLIDIRELGARLVRRSTHAPLPPAPSCRGLGPPRSSLACGTLAGHNTVRLLRHTSCAASYTPGCQARATRQPRVSR